MTENIETHDVDAMADAILALITERNGSVSFANLSRSIPGFDGDMAMMLEGGEDFSNICIWPGVSQAAGDAIRALEAAGAIHKRPTEVLVYLVDGLKPQLPLAMSVRHYKKMHWAPVVFYPGPSPRRQRAGATTKATA